MAPRHFKVQECGPQGPSVSFDFYPAPTHLAKLNVEMWKSWLEAVGSIGFQFGALEQGNGRGPEFDNPAVGGQTATLAL